MEYPILKWLNVIDDFEFINSGENYKKMNECEIGRPMFFISPDLDFMRYYERCGKDQVLVGIKGTNSILDDKIYTGMAEVSQFVDDKITFAVTLDKDLDISEIQTMGIAVFECESFAVPKNLPTRSISIDEMTPLLPRNEQHESDEIPWIGILIFGALVVGIIIFKK